VDKVQVFVNKEEIMQMILEIPQTEAEARGISRSVFQGIKKKIKETGVVNFDTHRMRRLIEMMNRYSNRI
jgi:diketogulonate reductase-like aldo/keto reductase